METLENKALNMDLDMERAILGSMLVAPEEILDKALSLLRSDYFVDPVHRTILSVFQELAGNGVMVDIVMVRNALTFREKLSLVGGVDYLVELTIWPKKWKHFEWYIESLAKLHKARTMVALTERLSVEVSEPGADVDLLREDYDAAAKRLMRSSNREATAEALEILIREIASGKRADIPWPWPQVTAEARCLQPDTITVLVGSGGTSKSLMMNQACLFWLAMDVPFCVYHLESDRAFHLKRALAQLCERASFTDPSFIASNTEVVTDAFEKNRALVDQLSLRMWDAPYEIQSQADMIGWLKERAGEGCRIFVLDPVTALDSGDRPWKSDQEFLLAARNVMRSCGGSLILVSHNRGGKVTKGDHLDNIAGGRAYGRFTDCVLTLESLPEPIEHKVRGWMGDDICTINRKLRLTKVRDGIMGMVMGLYFDRETLLTIEKGRIVT